MNEISSEIPWRPVHLFFFFFRFLLSLSVCSKWKKCIYYVMAKLNSKKQKKFAFTKNFFFFSYFSSFFHPCCFVHESILPNFFLCKRIIFPFFAVKLGHFIVNTYYRICYKHSSLRAKMGKWRKIKVGRIASICEL